MARKYELTKYETELFERIKQCKIFNFSSAEVLNNPTWGEANRQTPIYVCADRVIPFKCQSAILDGLFHHRPHWFYKHCLIERATDTVSGYVYIPLIPAWLAAFDVLDIPVDGREAMQQAYDTFGGVA